MIRLYRNELPQVELQKRAKTLTELQNLNGFLAYNVTRQPVKLPGDVSTRIYKVDITCP